MTVDTRRLEFSRGWPVVLAGFLGIALGLSPLPFYTVGVTAASMAQEFGWSFSSIMAGLAVSTLGVFVGGPLAGALSDRFGVRPVTLISLVIFAFAFMAFGFGNGSLKLYYATWFVMAVSGSATLPITWTRPISRQFVAHRGLALGLALFGTGLFGFMVKPLGAWLIEHHGWRSVYFTVGALPLLVALPVALAFFKDNPPSTNSDVAAPPEQAPEGIRMAEALRAWPFWAILLAFIPISAGIAGPIPNIENLLKSKAFGPDAIAQLGSAIGISVIFGRLLGGWLIDQFWAPAVAFVLLAISAGGCALLTQSEVSYLHALVAIFMVGFAAGMEFDLMAYLTTRYFGLKSYGTIYGVLYCGYAFGSGLGPVAYGAAFDKSGSYNVAVWGSVITLVVGGAVLLTCGRYRQASASH